MKRSLLALTLFCASLSSFAASHCQPRQDSCEMYKCEEGLRGCGDKGYLLSFGHKYCQLFLDSDTSKYGPLGQLWLVNVRYCLQEELEEMPRDLSCRELQQNGFESHVPCYVQTGFCSLPLQDKVNIFIDIRRSLLKPQVILSGLEVMKECMSMKELNELKLALELP